MGLTVVFCRIGVIIGTLKFIVDCLRTIAQGVHRTYELRYKQVTQFVKWFMNHFLKII